MSYGSNVIKNGGKQMSKRKSKNKQIITILSFLIVLSAAIVSGEFFLKTDKFYEVEQRLYRIFI